VTTSPDSGADAAQGRRDDALALADEAAEIAEASAAHGIMRQIEEARTQLQASLSRCDQSQKNQPSPA
jgi:hypothetical protein